MSACLIICDLLAEYLLDPSRQKDIAKAEGGDFSGFSGAEFAAIQYLKDNVTDRTWMRVGVHDLVFRNERRSKP